MGSLITVILAIVVWYMVKGECQNMSRYCVFGFGILLVFQAVLEIFTLGCNLGGRKMQHASGEPKTAQMQGGGESTTYTVTIEKTNFFDQTQGALYNIQSAVMIA